MQESIKVKVTDSIRLSLVVVKFRQERVYYGKVKIESKTFKYVWNYNVDMLPTIFDRKFDRKEVDFVARLTEKYRRSLED